MSRTSIHKLVQPSINQVMDKGLRDALTNAFTNKAHALEEVEQTFAMLGDSKPEIESMRTFLKSWHSTHLKMLPIYGLSCRMIKKGIELEDGDRRQAYYQAAAHNAETSFEDLNIDEEFELTHSELYSQLANTLCDGDEWTLSRYCIPEAESFKKWIYSNMVYQPIEVGLMTNLFSEIFNHGEYSIALPHFRKLFNKGLGFSTDKVEDMTLYIRAHVMDGVEEDHFNSVVKGLYSYNQAEGTSIDYSVAEALFGEYLERIGEVMKKLRQTTLELR